MYKYTYIFLYFILIFSHLNANQGCNISAIIEKESYKKEASSTFKIREEKIKKDKKNKIELKITETLTSVKVIHENETLSIKRTTKNKEHTCPPFCIQPMNIKGVKTLGELEVLDFIKGLNGKEARLFIDIRSNKKYKEYTIPGAINVPYTMLSENSKYQDEVLRLLGGKKLDEKWIFKSVPSLLIFGASNEDNKSYKSIKILLKLSYPNKKIYYYRAGVEGWKQLGLTIY